MAYVYKSLEALKKDDYIYTPDFVSGEFSPYGVWRVDSVHPGSVSISLMGSKYRARGSGMKTITLPFHRHRFVRFIGTNPPWKN